MLCVVLLQLVTVAKNAPMRCFELVCIFPPCTTMTCVIHPCELLAASSLLGAKALHIGRITRCMTCLSTRRRKAVQEILGKISRLLLISPLIGGHCCGVR